MTLGFHGLSRVGSAEGTLRFQEPVDTGQIRPNSWVSTKNLEPSKLRFDATLWPQKNKKTISPGMSKLLAPAPAYTILLKLFYWLWSNKKPA